MDGIFECLRWEWDGEIIHAHKNEENARRYTIGRRRRRFLKMNAQPFAVGPGKEVGEQLAAFLVELGEDDLDEEMPDGIKYEYICGSRKPDQRFIMFAYLWFSSIKHAKDYVSRKGMRILGGW